jgi:hypothetical protein
MVKGCVVLPEMDDRRQEYKMNKMNHEGVVSHA